MESPAPTFEVKDPESPYSLPFPSFMLTNALNRWDNSF